MKGKNTQKYDLTQRKSLVYQSRKKKKGLFQTVRCGKLTPQSDEYKLYWNYTNLDSDGVTINKR